MALGPVSEVKSTVVASTVSGEVTLASWTPASNDLVVVGVLKPAGDDPTVTGNGLAFTSIGSTEFLALSTTYIACIFVAQGAAPSAGSIVVTVEPLTATEVHVVAVRVPGARVGAGGLDAIETDLSTSDDAGNDMGGDLTTVTDNAWVLAYGGHGQADFTVPGDEVEILSNLQLGGNLLSSMWYLPVPTHGFVSIGAADDLDDLADWGLFAVVIKPAVAPNALMMMGVGA